MWYRSAMTLLNAVCSRSPSSVRGLAQDRHGLSRSGDRILSCFEVFGRGPNGRQDDFAGAVLRRCRPCASARIIPSVVCGAHGRARPPPLQNVKRCSGAVWGIESSLVRTRAIVERLGMYLRAGGDHARDADGQPAQPGLERSRMASGWTFAQAAGWILRPTASLASPVTGRSQARSTLHLDRDAGLRWFRFENFEINLTGIPFHVGPGRCPCPQLRGPARMSTRLPFNLHRGW